MKALFAAILILLTPVLPVSAAVAVNGSLTREHDIAPGRTYEGTIDVANPDAVRQEFKVYLTDYRFSADGTVEYGAPGKLARSNALWITVTPAQASIPPGETLTVRYSIQVPSDGTLKGTYWSVIMIEPIDQGSPESSAGKSNAKVSVGIREVLRYGVQVVTSVGETGARSLKFGGIRLQADHEKRLLIVDLENTGERWLRASVYAELYDAAGNFIGRFDGGKHRMFPGTAARFTAELAGVASTTYKALIIADCGGDDVFGANVSLVLRQ